MPLRPNLTERSRATTATVPGAGAGRARTGLGGSHTVVTYPPLRALEPLIGDEPFRIDAASPLHLYFHVAFCEYICSFCHYQRTYTHPERQAEAVEPYIDALGREVDYRSAALDGAQIQSVYLGGGTPTALTLGSLERLVGHMGRLVDLRETYFAFETSPKTAVGREGAAKLACLVASGAKRVSIGVQTFDELLLRQQRGHDGPELDEALTAVFALGIPVNIDLIQDLPLQQEDHIEADLLRIQDLKPDQVTWYTLRAEKGSTIGKLEGSRTAREAALFSSMADSEQSIRRRLRIISAMRSMGYHPQPGGRFLREAAGADLFKSVRNGLDTNLLGFGLSSYSHGWGYFFRNIENRHVAQGIGEYITRMCRQETPVGSLMRLSDLERAASVIVQAARSVIPFSLLDRDDESGQGWRQAAARCVEEGLMVREATGLRLSATGMALEEEVASLFYSAPVRKALTRLGAYWAGPEWFQPGPMPARRRTSVAAATEGV